MVILRYVMRYWDLKVQLYDVLLTAAFKQEKFYATCVSGAVVLQGVL